MFSRKPWHTMIVLTLLLVLIGSFAAAITMALKGASLWVIALSYMIGGWIGFLIGLPVLLFIARKIDRLHRMSLAPTSGTPLEAE